MKSNLPSTSLNKKSTKYYFYHHYKIMINYKAQLKKEEVFTIIDEKGNGQQLKKMDWKIIFKFFSFLFL